MILLNTTIDQTILDPKESDIWYSTFIYYSLLIAIAICCTLQYLAKTTKANFPSTNNTHFLNFQKKYFIVYFLALFGDWLQGPYIYKLYSHYGFAPLQISMLYIVGFSSSMLFGTAAGVFADSFGRKKMCMVFCITYSLCCFLTIFPNYNILLLGKILSGLSTSLLFSVFESWYIYEHIHNHDFPKEWISITFSFATFGNGVLAIAAGIIANFTAEIMEWGLVTPFLLAIPCFVVSCFVISQAWNENYGNRNKSSHNIWLEGLKVILMNKLVLLLGLIQTGFESVMYIFVFLWTPILDVKHLPLGIVFSSFMVGIMIGSSIYQLAVYHHIKPHFMLLVSVVLATIAQLGCALATSYSESHIVLVFSSFFLLEISVGIYFPAIGYIKSEYIPESHRVNIMNWFRVPMNIIICLLLLGLHRGMNSSENCVIFLLCSVMMTFCSVIMLKIIQLMHCQIV